MIAVMILPQKQLFRALIEANLSSLKEAELDQTELVTTDKLRAF